MRWLCANIALLIVYLYATAVCQAIVLLLLSSDGSVGAGWGGNPIEQIIGWAMFGGWIAVFLSPLVAVVLVPYRIVVHVLGRPRAIALIFAIAAAGVAPLLLPQVEPSNLVVLGLVILGYAALLRMPGQTLAGLPAWLRGSVVGLALSQVWIAGSVVGLARAAYRTTHGAKLEGGAIAFGATVIPTMLLFADLFREGVPAENYVITTVLAAGSAFGLFQMVTAGTNHAPRDEAV